jgi:hypothetical protein
MFLLGDYDEATNEEKPSENDPRWPSTCEKCGYIFQEVDERQLFCRHLWQKDTGEIYTLEDAPPGAMWDATWFHDVPRWQGPDGKALVVKCPPDGWDWHIDGRASNCTRKDDNVHKCWVRHGVPPDITVDKIGDTCAAGAGSIQTPKWHGFLREGWLTN